MQVHFFVAYLEVFSLVDAGVDVLQDGVKYIVVVEALVVSERQEDGVGSEQLDVDVHVQLIVEGSGLGLDLVK